MRELIEVPKWAENTAEALHKAGFLVNVETAAAIIAQHAPADAVNEQMREALTNTLRIAQSFVGEGHGAGCGADIQAAKQALSTPPSRDELVEAASYVVERWAKEDTQECNDLTEDFFDAMNRLSAILAKHQKGEM